MCVPPGASERTLAHIIEFRDVTNRKKRAIPKTIQRRQIDAVRRSTIWINVSLSEFRKEKKKKKMFPMWWKSSECVVYVFEVYELLKMQQ